MSRCFPFPPPGYILNGIRDEAVIKSIKGIEEKSKKDQRKREKKRKAKEGKNEESEKTRSSHKRQRKEEVTKDDQNQKVSKQSEIESLEKSSLTVEHELLQTTSCDSTHNSNEILQKHHKEKQILDDGRHNNDSESTIRIKLPIRRQKDLEMMMVMMTNKDQQKLNPSLGLCSLCPPSMAMQFLNVVENWVPKTIDRRRVEDEECWWLSKKPRDKQFNKEMKQVVISSSMAWPCALLLPEADVYSLPYTVPF